MPRFDLLDEFTSAYVPPVQSRPFPARACAMYRLAKIAPVVAVAVFLVILTVL
jgi:hypothetical protein